MNEDYCGSQVYKFLKLVRNNCKTSNKACGDANWLGASPRTISGNSVFVGSRRRNFPSARFTDEQMKPVALADFNGSTIVSVHGTRL
jgi:hypothetical protein